MALLVLSPFTSSLHVSYLAHKSVLNNVYEDQQDNTTIYRHYFIMSSLKDLKTMSYATENHYQAINTLYQGYIYRLQQLVVIMTFT